MKDVKNVKKAFAFNAAIFVLVVFSVLWMMSGLSGGVFSASRLAILRYFTIDSNILMGIAALIAAIDERKVITGKKQEISRASYIVKLTGTVGVTLTMLVTIFFLAPNAIPTTGFFSLFYYSNFFLHLLTPVVSIASFLLFEKSMKIPFRHTFTAIIPLLLYAVYYVYEAVTHLENGRVMRGYDWYGFLIGGIRSAFIVLPLIILITYLISFVLWKLNRRGVLAREV